MKFNNSFVHLLITSLFFCLFPSILSGQKLLEIPKPTHSEAGVPCATLKVVKEIQSDIDEDIFFALPIQLSVNKGGRLYVFDEKLIRILVFDQQFKYTRQFLSKGRGPGEIFALNYTNTMIYAGTDNDIYVSNPLGDKLIRFSPQGKIVKESRLNRAGRSMAPFLPVVDKNGYLYAYSLNNGLVDKMDQDMTLVHTYLDRNLTKRFLMYRPPFEVFHKNNPAKIDREFTANTDSVVYDITSDGHLVIYLIRSSTIYIFNGKRLIKSFDVMLERTITGFREKAMKALKLQKERFSKGIDAMQTISMFRKMIVDRDAPYFYLLYTVGIEYGILYQFDLSGKLLKIYEKFYDKGFPVAKANGLFYGWTIGDRHPIIFSEEEIP